MLYIGYGSPALYHMTTVYVAKPIYANSMIIFRLIVTSICDMVILSTGWDVIIHWMGRGNPLDGT